MISLQLVRHSVIALGLALVFQSPNAIGGTEKSETITGKVVEYRANEKFVVNIASAGNREITQMLPDLRMR